jgi:hypothetical protein
MPVKTTDSQTKSNATAPWTLVYGLMTRVGMGEITMNDAQRTLRDTLTNLSEDEQQVWRSSGVDFVRRLLQIAEAFQEEITVLTVRR